MVFTVTNDQSLCTQNIIHCTRLLSLHSLADSYMGLSSSLLIGSHPRRQQMSKSSPCESQTTHNINFIYLCIVFFLNLFWFIFDSFQLRSELCHMFLIHDWLWYQTLRKKQRHSKKFIHQLQHEIFRSFNTFMQQCSYQLYAWMKETDICSTLIWKVLDKCHSDIKNLTCLVWWQKLIK